MADDTEIGEITVKLEGVDAPSTSTQQPVEDPVKDLKGQYETLTAQVKAGDEARRLAEQRAVTAEADAQRARQEAQAARSETADRELDTVNSGLSAAQAEVDAALTAYSVAMEAGNFDAAGKAQQRIARAEGQAAILSQSKIDLESRKNQRVQEIVSRETLPRQQPAPQDQVEQFASRLTPASGAWIRQHPECITDARKNSRMMEAHYGAIADGVQADTPQYFEFLEKRLGYKTDPTQQEPTVRREPSRQQARVAPVTPSTNGSRMNTTTEVRLNHYEHRAAIDGTHVWSENDLKRGLIKDPSQVGEPIGVSEFARRKAIMQKQGHYDRMFLDS